MSSMSVMAFAADTEAGTTAEKGSVAITKYEGTEMDMKRLKQIMEQFKMCQQKKS